MKRSELHFDDPLTAFKFVSKNYQKVCILSNSLGLLKENKQNILIGVRSPSISGTRIAMAPSAIAMRKVTLMKEIDELETRQMQLDLVLDVVDRVIQRLPPQYRFYSFAIYVEKKKLTDPIFQNVSDLHRLPTKLKKCLIEVLTDEDQSIIEGILNEDLLDADFFTITR